MKTIEEYLKEGRKQSPSEIAMRLASGDTVNRVDMPDMKIVLLNLKAYETNIKDAIKQIEKELRK